MIGGIYENKSGKGARWRVKFKSVHRRFADYREAERFLTGLRFQHDQGHFDPRDWMKDKPLGFANLAEQWLAYRKHEVRCFRNLQLHMRYAVGFLGDRNIKEITFADLEDFLLSLPSHLSAKSKKNIFATLHSFYTWLQKRQVLSAHQVPEFPEVHYELGWRKTVDKETQERIIEEVRRISYNINQKIWFGVFLLASYPKVRPGEIITVNEEHIDLEQGIMFVPKSKVEPKKIYLLEEDVAFIKSCVRGLPPMPFFRHQPKRKGVSQKHYQKRGGRFGKDYLYGWWKRACRNLGVKDVDLYGGTRHSSATAARETMTPEEIRMYITEHKTNKAFDRYLQVDAQKQREASRVIRGTKKGRGGTKVTLSKGQ